MKTRVTGCLERTISLEHHLLWSSFAVSYRGDEEVTSKSTDPALWFRRQVNLDYMGSVLSAVVLRFMPRLLPASLRGSIHESILSSFSVKMPCLPRSLSSCFNKSPEKQHLSLQTNSLETCGSQGVTSHQHMLVSDFFLYERLSVHFQYDSVLMGLVEYCLFSLKYQL